MFSSSRRNRVPLFLAGSMIAVAAAGSLLHGSGGMAASSAAAAAGQAAPPKTPDVIYVPTPPGVVAEMLKVAEVKPGNVVYDLGCGDGRIVISAAKDFGARGIGVDIDPKRIEESNANAKTAGVTDKVKFLQQDLFEMDFRDADVVALYLLNSLNVRLRPKLLAELKPGARVVSHAFNMGDWKPDKSLTPEGRNVYLWVIPARVEGNWTGTLQTAAGEKPFTLALTQKYQDLSGTVTVDGKSAPLAGSSRMNGDRMELAVAAGNDLGLGTPPPGQGEMKWTARASGDALTGESAAGKWTARRAAAATPATPATNPPAAKD